MDGLITTDFVTTVRPVYEKLVQLRDEFTKADVTDPEEALETIARLEAAEHNVLVAWAQSTRDINPGMLGDVESGRLTWYPALGEYLGRVLYA